MFWPDRGSGVVVEPARRPVASAVRQFFTEGGPGVPPTVPGGDWFNQITNELLNVLTAAGIDPSKTDDEQLLQAISMLIQAGGSDVLSLLFEPTGSEKIGDGPGTVKTSLDSLRATDITLSQRINVKSLSPRFNVSAAPWANGKNARHFLVTLSVMVHSLAISSPTALLGCWPER
ncbi:hypothetical protein PCI56_07710 [Plesiomonas shigelloides subsp. oncorhynchi]|nr:hypothetical protein [Plesiomonas shigelloides]